MYDKLFFYYIRANCNNEYYLKEFDFIIKPEWVYDYKNKQRICVTYVENFSNKEAAESFILVLEINAANLVVSDYLSMNIPHIIENGKKCHIEIEYIHQDNYHENLKNLYYVIRDEHSFDIKLKKYEEKDVKDIEKKIVEKIAVEEFISPKKKIANKLNLLD